MRNCTVKLVQDKLKPSDPYTVDPIQRVVMYLGDDTTDTASMDSSTDSASEPEMCIVMNE